MSVSNKVGLRPYARQSVRPYVCMSVHKVFFPISMKFGM